MLLQFDQDISSKQRELFLYIRKIILSFTQIKEIKNAKQTSYKDNYSTVCMMRVRQEAVRVSFANGTRMKEQFPELLGDAKIVRFLEFQTINEVNEKRLKTILKESIILNMEKYELRRLKADQFFVPSAGD